MAQSHPSPRASSVLRSMLALSTLVGSAWLPPTVVGQLAPSPLDTAVRSITDQTMRSHLAVLAHDQLRGRDTPSQGLEIAATYLAELHRSYGLEPGGLDGSFMQRFPFGLMGPDPENAEVVVVGPNGSREIEVGRDAFFDGGTEERLRAPLTFVRFGPDARADRGSMEGEIAVFSLPGAWGQELWQASLEQAAFARASGATAVVHLLDSGFPASDVGQLGATLAQPRLQLGGDAFLPRLFLGRRALEEVIPEEARPWNGSASGAGGNAVRQRLTGVTLRGRLPLNVVSRATPPNVLAELRGSDPTLRNEYVVLTAHFDHVGVGRAVDGDSIYNGADDNGSGTSALLEVARALGSLPAAQRPRRSILFAHVSGEEKGLLGSEWWVDHSTRPIENVVANINTDMISGDTHPDTVAVLGRDYSSLGGVIQSVNRRRPELGLTTVPDMWPQEGLFFRSDQLNFMREEIPSLFLFAGFHDCYHKPCDDLSFVNLDKASRVTRLLAYTAMEIANADDPPEWNPAGLAETRRMTSGGR